MDWAKAVRQNVLSLKQDAKSTLVSRNNQAQFAKNKGGTTCARDIDLSSWKPSLGANSISGHTIIPEQHAIKREWAKGGREGAECGPGHACVLCEAKCENKVGLREHAFLFLSLCLEGFANEGGFVLMITTLGDWQLPREFATQPSGWQVRRAI